MNFEVALQRCRDLIHNYGYDPLLGIAFLIIVFVTAIVMAIREEHPKVKIESIADRMNLKSKDCIKVHSHKPIQEEPMDRPRTSFGPQGNSKYSYADLKERVKAKYFTTTKKSLIYVTVEEKEEERRRVEEERELMGRNERRERQLKERQLREKEDKKREEQKQKLRQKEEDKRREEEARQKVESQKSVRSTERKTTIQKTIQDNQAEKASEDSKSQTFTNISKEQLPSLFNNIPKTSLDVSQSFLNAPKEPAPSILASGPNLTSVKMPNQQGSIPQPPPKQAPKQAPKQVQRPKETAAEVPPKPAVAPQVANIKNLTGEQYLQAIIKFAEPQTATVQIPTIMANLGGAKSSLNDVLVFAQSFIDTVRKGEEGEVSAFAVKIYEGMVRQISSSNLKEGIYRIPPKSKTDQVEKNSINCYILYINLYRLMGYEKVWLVIFGKLLSLLQFLYKRKDDLKKYTELELLANRHLERRGEVEGKYLSRVDYLTYMLLGLAAYDPIMVFRQVEEKEPNVRESRQEVESWGREWNYKEFWVLTHLILSNKHDSYFKPIVYMNILSSLYPRIYAHKRNPDHFKPENELYKLVLEEGKKYFSRFKTIKQLKVLQESEEGSNFEYDGDNFVQGIKVLQSRLTVEKVKEFNIKTGDNTSNAREFEAKSNVFYYFCKQK